MSQISKMRSRGRARRTSAHSTAKTGLTNLTKQTRQTLSRVGDGMSTATRTTSNRTVKSGRLSGLARHRPSRKTMVLAGVAVVAAAIAVPMAKAGMRAARSRMNARRDRRLSGVRGLDSLTSLPNRAEAEWWLNRRLNMARVQGHRLAVLVMDLDDFAACNDAYGRPAGDHVLQVTAVRLQSLLRTGDMVCRTGNDTFMVIMDVDGPDHHVARIGERVVDAVAEPIRFGDETIFVTASVGFAISQDREGDPQLLLGRADRAVIQAKASQRPIVQF